jgi:transposase
MNRDHSWLTDGLFSKIGSRLPTDAGGKAGVGHRRVVGGIVHVLKSCGRWADVSAAPGPSKTLCNRFARCAEKGAWVALVHTFAQASAPPEQVLIDSSAVKAHRSASGEKRGAESSDRPLARRAHDDPKGREANIHALTDAQSRPLAFMLTGGQVADCTAGARLLEQLPDCEITQADKSDDANAIRRQLEERGAMPNIPPKANRKWKKPLLAVPLSEPKRHRAHVLPPRGFSARGDTIRPQRGQLPRRRLIAAAISYWL